MNNGNICRGISSELPTPEEALEWFGRCGQSMHLPAGEVFVVKYYNGGYQRLAVARSEKGLRAAVSAIFSKEGWGCARTRFLRGNVAKLPLRHVELVAQEVARHAMYQAWGDVHTALRRDSSPLLVPCPEEVWVCTGCDSYDEYDAQGDCEECGAPLAQDTSHYGCTVCCHKDVFVGKQTLWEITQNWMTSPHSRYSPPEQDRSRHSEDLPDATHYVGKDDGWGQWKPDIFPVMEDPLCRSEPVAFAIQVTSEEPPPWFDSMEEELREVERTGQELRNAEFERIWQAERAVEKSRGSSLVSDLGVY